MKCPTCAYFHWSKLNQLTINDEGEVLPVLLTCCCVNLTSVDSSITVAQPTIAGNLEHCSTISIVSLSDVSISDAHFCPVGEEPVDRRVCWVAGRTVDVEVGLERECRVFIQTIAVDAKSNNDGIKSCREQG